MRALSDVVQAADIPQGVLDTAPAAINAVANVIMILVMAVIGCRVLAAMTEWLQVSPERNRFARWLATFGLALAGSYLVGSALSRVIHGMAEPGLLSLLPVVVAPVAFVGFCGVLVSLVQHAPIFRALIAAAVAGITSFIASVLLVVLLSTLLRTY